jgi:NADH-quinone oxidoreductase subunit A
MAHTSVLAPYVPMILILLVGAALTVLLFSLSTFVGTKVPNAEKDMPFECGSDSVGGRHVKPSVKFYMTAILFVVFDLEVVLMYPWAVNFRALGATGFVTMISFTVLLVAALIYVWRKGALEWEK